MNRPQTYKDWRQIYRQEIQALGYDCFYSYTKSSNIIVDKIMYQRINRIYRIKLRLDVEREAQTESYMEALFEMILKEIFE